MLDAKSAYCIPKAILLVAAARAVGIQAGIGLSDVVNHLTTEKLKERLGGLTYFMHHGYAVMYLEGQWVKAAPAFNIELCNRFGVRPTEFDGRVGRALSGVRHQQPAPHGIRQGPRRLVRISVREGRWPISAAFYPLDAFGEEPAGERFEDGVPVRASLPRAQPCAAT